MSNKEKEKEFNLNCFDMAKRFTDNGKWKKKFFKKLSPKHKLLWIYILDDCDHAGIWEVDLEVAELRIGESLDENEIIDLFEGQIQVIRDGEKWFIPDFITFQYGELNPNSRVHQSVIELLQKNGINQEQDNQDIEIPAKKSRFKKPTLIEVKEYCQERQNQVDAEGFLNFYESKGWKIGKSAMKCWKSAVRTWEKNNFSQNKTKNKVATNLQTWGNVKSMLKN